MSSRTLPLPPPVTWSPGLQGEYPGQQSQITLPGGVPMVFCWCPPHATGPGFWLGKHLVTQAQWQEVRGKKNPSRKSQGDAFPVDSVSYEMAEDFAEASRKLFPDGDTELWLPKEAQWDHACRAGRMTDFGIGAGDVLNGQMANFDGNYPAGDGDDAFKWLYREKTLPVGSFPPNAWGLHDMHGQLWEWCDDWLDKQNGYRVLRGGGWINSGRYAAASIRHGHDPQIGAGNYGLRVSPSSIQTRKERNEGRAERSKNPNDEFRMTNG